MLETVDAGWEGGGFYINQGPPPTIGGNCVFNWFVLKHNSQFLRKYIVRETFCDFRVAFVPVTISKCCYRALGSRQGEDSLQEIRVIPT